MIKIEKEIPIPENLGDRKVKYPFKYMEIGDSFLFRDNINEDNLTRAKNSVTSSIRHSQKKLKDKKFVFSVTEVNKIYTVRVFRTA